MMKGKEKLKEVKVEKERLVERPERRRRKASNRRKRMTNRKEKYVKGKKGKRELKR